MPVTAFIGIGANLGDARANVLDAVERLGKLPGATLEAVSSLYRTAPIDSSGDDYINAVARVSTALPAQALLEALFDIEQAHGRERPYFNAPRTLDLDLLLYGEEQITTPTLVVPHPRMHLRAFVLMPLLELAPGVVLPGLGRAADFAPSVSDQGIIRL
ncbi:MULTISPECIES: 2-amino-4-hydroxy-6-hydroxymethyldihydropteridine diphosphokinase [unclassified Duganella]|uniref:2-amino-4-hydroxy-6- hydroxymethyldihydropteridine diphosphokinase n=1 Tax=unclassified Duganella TaxID=2636909 RepID=UPI0006F43A82|nr:MULTISPECIES: 2-amino-4-hydroxy-6-hydroxymethyldihydropteridine diphosphokinase [unclassified Duganella]KQV47614.1 2-amino-4-hydroxy-6-hydroxymethyldihydropteridine pyrophosphokinase [Duganella sp. Root336D2]KRB82099.1 2-amino-4-hydroxy-6-hydroxymethyldihydropteridine pyrophosphokinase [Duganella sp. Root198D2]